MSEKELERLGFKKYSHEKYTHPIYFKYVVNIPTQADINFVLKIIFDEGLSLGKSQGWADLAESFRFLLNVEKIKD